MHLIYVDESGNTGANLGDPQQPIFVLCALIVPETCWQSLEAQLEQALINRFPQLAALHAEVHAADLRNGKSHFGGVPVDERLSLRDEWLTIARNHELKLVYRAIAKSRFQKWVLDRFGAGVKINPYVFAFPLVARVVDEYLTSLTENALGMFISDENKEIVRDVEKHIKFLRGTEGTLRLSRIVEKGFFIDSRKSRVLQLCDVCGLNARKREEHLAGGNLKSIDELGVALIEPLIHRGNESFQDVIAWLSQQQSP